MFFATCLYEESVRSHAASGPRICFTTRHSAFLRCRRCLQIEYLLLGRLIILVMRLVNLLILHLLRLNLLVFLLQLGLSGLRFDNLLVQMRLGFLILPLSLLMLSVRFLLSMDFRLLPMGLLLTLNFSGLLPMCFYRLSLSFDTLLLLLPLRVNLLLIYLSLRL